MITMQNQVEPMLTMVKKNHCSIEFINAFDAVRAGKNIRRESWEAGVFLKQSDDNPGSIEIVAPDFTRTYSWFGPSATEVVATDWKIINEK